jgi:hypothetical protein
MNLHTATLPSQKAIPTPHLTIDQIEALLTSSAAAPCCAVIPYIAAAEDTAAAEDITPIDTAAAEADAVVPAQPESPHWTSSNPTTLAAAVAHLHACAACATELANLRESLSLFRQATAAHAARELRSLPPIATPSRPLLLPALQPAHWMAAAAMLMIALLPIQNLRQHLVPSAPAAPPAIADSAQSQSQSQSQSDAALLDDVDRVAYASVPASMQVLADPAVSESSADTSAAGSLSSTTQNSDQRKD